MQVNNSPLPYPSLYQRLFSVWFRHYRVYTKNLFSNGLPPFLEPVIFLAGIGLGLGHYVSEMDGISYLQFLGTGLPITAAMFTASFECTYGTFIRLEFDRVYDGMLAAPITVPNLLVGEMLWAGSKGVFFSLAVIVVIALFGIVSLPLGLLTGLVGLLTGVMFAALSLFITSLVANINHFNFYFTGFLSPMFFFSGVIFPLQTLPPFIRPFAELFPLTHSVRLARSLSLGRFNAMLWLDVLYIVIFSLLFGFFAIRRLKKRLVG
jgi:lipooligosaccharide transport system permease protein